MKEVIEMEGAKINQAVLETLQFIQESESAHVKTINDAINFIVAQDIDYGESESVKDTLELIQNLTGIRRIFKDLEANEEKKKGVAA